jgi:hypothetical protein
MRPSVVFLVVTLATVTVLANAEGHNPAVRSGKTNTTTKSAPARTRDGHPDLQGVWTNDTSTPLERPKQFAGKAFFDASEQAAFEAAVWAGILANLGDENVRTSGDFQFDELGKPLADRRTALLIDPPNGEIPPLLPAAQLRLRESLDRRKQHLADGPEDFPLPTRCITWPSPPMLPFVANALLRIVQTHDYVLIHNEMFSEARVVPTDGRPHLPATVRRWKGDSVGSWDGETLVVDTTNFRPDKDGHALGGRLRGADEVLHVIERFSLADAHTIRYRFTVDDPTAYATAWTAEVLFSRTTKPMLEYACHEGNYSLKNSLTGARAVERRKVADPQ